MNSIKLELLTPCFCAGYDQKSPEIRIPSIRGQLRFWTRLLFDPSHDQRAEYLLFGGIKGKSHGYSKEGVASSISLRLRVQPFQPLSQIPLCPHSPPDQQKGRRNAIPPNTVFEIFWHERLAHSEERMNKFLKVIEAWSLLGGLGARQTRAAGSVWQYGYTPTISDFEKRVKLLFIPTSVKIAVLDNPQNDSEELRKIATNTLVLDSNDALGYVRRTERKTSPLKLKVGRFTDGFRLIAIADNRDNRGGNLQKAIESLLEHNKLIGELLNRARWF